MIFGSQPIVTNGLVLNLDASSMKSYPRTGSIWNDLSGNNNSGSLVNSPNLIFDKSPVIRLDGTNQYVESTNSSTLDITGNLTVECWFKINAVASDWVRILGKGDNTNRTYGLWYNTSANAFLYQRYSTLTPVINVQYNSTVRINLWYHMVGVSDGSIHTLYLNGVSVATQNLSRTALSTTNTFKLGYGDIHTYHNGLISCARVYNRALSLSELFNNYNSQKTRFNL